MGLLFLFRSAVALRLCREDGVYTMKKRKERRTYIGGQAVLEGVMMRGKTAVATAVRDDAGKIQVEAERIRKKKTSSFFRLPFVRGVVNLVDSLIVGTKTLMRSADVYGGEESEEPGKFEKWLAEKFKADITSVVATVSMILGLVLSIGLFVFLPYLFSDLIAKGTGMDPKGFLFNLMEGGFRVLIFILYILLTSLMPDIRRTYMYHGAEHMTINCYETGMPLTKQNVMNSSRIHDRCGTTFLFLVMIISILVFSIANSLLGFEFENRILTFLVRLAIKLLLLPVVAGISYEVLKFLSKFDNPFITVLKAPGLSLQFLTTREPTPDMVKCAITAFVRVQMMDEEPAYGESSFAVGGRLENVKARVDELFARAGIEGDDANWIFSLTFGIPFSALEGEKDRQITVSEARKLYKIVNERLTGRPLWYIIGDTSFCGYTIKVDERVLIPRPETEILVENAVKDLKDGNEILDLCTGSGAIAIATYKLCEAANKKIRVTASDVSADALTLAKENATLNGAEIEFEERDFLNGEERRYDCVLCNPPYIPAGEIDSLQREVKDFEPRGALCGGEDGLDFYRRLAGEFTRVLKKGGFMLLELGMGQAKEVKELFESAGAGTEILRDLAGVERILKVKI